HQLREVSGIDGQLPDLRAGNQAGGCGRVQINLSLRLLHVHCLAGGADLQSSVYNSPIVDVEDNVVRHIFLETRRLNHDLIPSNRKGGGHVRAVLASGNGSQGASSLGVDDLNLRVGNYRPAWIPDNSANVTGDFLRHDGPTEH